MLVGTTAGTTAGLETDWLTPQEVAGCLRISRWTVYRWIDEGRLPAIKIGRSLRIARSALTPFARTTASE